jgi:hypothetical protein
MPPAVKLPSARSSAEKGCSKAYLALALHNDSGRCLTKNIGEANRCFKLSIDLGFTEAQFYYAVNLMKGDCVRKNSSEVNR